MTLCFYIVFRLLGSVVDKYLFIQFVIILFLVTTVVLIIVKYIALNKKLTITKDHLITKQAKIEKKIESLAIQTQKLETKFIKITNIFQSKVSKFNLAELDKSDHTNSFFNKQMDLNEQTDPKKKLIGDEETDLLTWEILLKALNFPKDKNDLEGFSALKLAHMDNTVSDLLQVSEDFLNLIAQDGIYLDDVKIDPPPVQAWLNFIGTDRNHNNRKLNCIGIDQQIKKLNSRIKSDAIFRDTSLTLMRRFDLLLRDRLETANDSQIFKIAETRSGKAFLIVGKLSDSF